MKTPLLPFYFFGTRMYVERELCKGCKKCVKACPQSAIRMIGKKAYIFRTRCNHCILCERMCPQNAIRVFPRNSYSGGRNPIHDYTHRKKGPALQASGNHQ
jgi:ferredoxin